MPITGWTGAALPPTSTSYWIDVAYGNGVFVAINGAGSNVAAYSTDGITWTPTTLPSVAAWETVTFISGVFIALTSTFSGGGASNVGAYSTDGINWTGSTLPFSDYWSRPVLGNGTIVSVGVNSISDSVAYSTDTGKTWTASGLPNPNMIDGPYNVSNAVFGNGVFVAYYQNSYYVAYSTDGVTWNQGTTPASLTLGGAPFFLNGLFIIGAGNGNFIYSTDGINWSAGVLPAATSLGLLAYGNGVFTSVSGATGLYSTDGINWSAATLPFNGYWSAILFADGIFAVVAQLSGNAISSADGITWVESAMPLSADWRGLAYGASLFVTLASLVSTAAYSRPPGNPIYMLT